MLHTQPRSTEMQETVFIVDDDEAVRDSLQWLIETEGYQVRTYFVRVFNIKLQTLVSAWSGYQWINCKEFPEHVFDHGRQ